jgi:hypothetical protein
MEDLAVPLSAETMRRLHQTDSVLRVVDVLEANAMDELVGQTPAISDRLSELMAGANPVTTTASLSKEQA